MTKLKISGGRTLEGIVKISGAKNSAVALIPAAILCDESVSLYNVPNISDIENLLNIMKYLNASYKKEDDNLYIDATNSENKEITTEMSKKLRASYYFLGSLLGKYKKAVVSMPGGCTIGERPIDLHLKGFEKLGAKIECKDGKVIVTAKELIGSDIYLDFASVGATINIMLAAVKAKGTTVIENAAKEPEIVNVAMFLNAMGAKISGAGTSQIVIEGVKYLKGCIHEVIPDRIEAGTYTIIGALIGNNLKIDNIIPEHLDALISKLVEMGIQVKIGEDYLIVSKSDNYKPVKINTLVYPGFPTDLQQPFTILLTQCKGRSIVNETIWENRFNHVQYLNKMGADIKVEGTNAKIYGPTNLKAQEVNATDLRAGACLVCAALIAEGETIINNADYILRGYADIVEKLTKLGAKIELIQI